MANRTPQNILDMIGRQTYVSIIKNRSLRESYTPFHSIIKNDTANQMNISTAKENYFRRKFA